MNRTATKLRPLLAKMGLALLVPLAILAGAEAILRGVGAGYPASFLRQVDIAGETHWADNPFYGYRFFTPALARNPAPIAAACTKPPRTTRIVVLGESAAQGDPMLEYGMPRMLEKMLNEGSTNARFEVINAAMTAISSPIVADIARETTVLQPDIYIVYAGNNEVVGPYGPGTVFTPLKEAPWLTPWRVRLTRLRLTWLLSSLLDALRTNPAEAWQGLAMFGGLRFAHDDPRLEPMYRAFARNLDQIIATAQRQGARVILSTVAVNLADCAPFGSESADSLPAADRARWLHHLEAGSAAQAAQRPAEARTHLEQAEILFPRHAETVYRLAQILAEQGETDAARLRFQRARDLDTQRFRADHRINTLIRAAARHPVVELVDADALFGAKPAAPGAEQFLDHVHFTFAGTWQLAHHLAEAIHGPDLPDLEACRGLMLFTPWAERQQATLMEQRRARPPFVRQPGNEKQRQELLERIQRAQEMIQTQDLGQVQEVYQRQAARYPADFFLPLQWGTILGESGRWEDAAPILTQALERLPLHVETRLPAALALSRTGRPEEAAGLLIGRGPPHGLYLAEYALQILRTLLKEGYPEEARRLQAALLERAPRFPHRAAVAAWTETETP